MNAVWIVQRVDADNPDDNVVGVFRNDRRAKKRFQANDWEWISLGWGWDERRDQDCMWWSDELSMCIWKADVE